MRIADYSLTVFQEPVEGFTYAAGGDPAEGLERGDDSVLEIACCDNGEHVCELSGKIEPVAFGELCFLLGTWYNQALIGIENNRDNTANRVLFDLGYPNIFFEQRETGRAYRDPTARLGWNTNLRTRPILIAEGRKWMRDRSIQPRSIKLVNQFKHFALHAGKFQALPGAHDDFVMAWLICIEMFRFQLQLIEARENNLVPLVNGEPINSNALTEMDERPEIDYSQKLINRVHGKDRNPDLQTGMGTYV